MTNFSMGTASKTLKTLARQLQNSTHRDTGYSRAIGWIPTVQGGAIVEYEDETCETFSAADLASADE